MSWAQSSVGEGLTKLAYTEVGSPVRHKVRCLKHTSNPSIHEMEARRVGAIEPFSHPWLHNELEASLGYMRPDL